MMMRLLADIYMLPMAPVSEGLDACIKRLSEELPLTVHEYTTGQDYNGWVIPPKWEILAATIHKDGELIYDGTIHPLGVISMSESFSGMIDLASLKQHLVTYPKLPDAIVYHWEKFYRPSQLDWGFSIPYSRYRELEEGDYLVDLQTELTSGTMKVADFFLPGETQTEIILNAHSCHAGQANDDSSGIVTGIEIMKQLGKKANRKYSYRLLVTPELYGTAFWLKDRSAEQRNNIHSCILLKAVGNNDVLRLQHSFDGDKEIDHAAAHWLSWNEPSSERGAYREVYGNDETVFEAPGFEIPTVTFTRVAPIPGPHYPEYHTSADDLTIVTEERLEQCVKAVLGTIDIVERNSRLSRQFEGLICLGNPRFNLYIQAPDPSVRPTVSFDDRKWYMLMTCLPRYLDGNWTILEIAEKHELPFGLVADYVAKYEEKKLISTHQQSASRLPWAIKNGR